MAAAQKKAHANGWRVVFIDESGFYLLPGRRRTYAPCGQTPVLHAPCRYDHLSVMAAVTIEGQFYARVRTRSFNSFDSVTFIQCLQALWPERKLLVIWDGSPIHRFRAVRAFQETAAAENFVFERLPGYAPDLNSLDAGVWHHLKNVALANVCCHDLDHSKRNWPAPLGLCAPNLASSKPALARQNSACNYKFFMQRSVGHCQIHERNCLRIRNLFTGGQKMSTSNYLPLYEKRQCR